MRSRLASQRGSISIVAAAVIGVVLICCAGVADVAKVSVARAHAQAAADAAALAAAQELAFATGIGPTAVAGEYALRNDAKLVTCLCEPGALQATVRVAVSTGSLLLLPGWRHVYAWARAVVDFTRVGSWPRATRSPPKSSSSGDRTTAARV